MSTVRKALDDQAMRRPLRRDALGRGLPLHRALRRCRCRSSAHSLLAATALPRADFGQTRDATRRPARGSAATRISAVRVIAATATRSRCSAALAESDPEDARATAASPRRTALLCLHAEPSEAHRAAAAAALCTALELDRYCADVQHARAQVAVMRDDYAEAYCRLPRGGVAGTRAIPGLVLPWPRPRRAGRPRGAPRPLSARRGSGHGRLPGAGARANSRSSAWACTTMRAALAVTCVRAAEEALRRQPDDVRALSLVACVLPTLGRKTEARGWAERAVALEPLEPFVNFNAACVYIALRDYDRALHFLRARHAVGGGQLQLDRARPLRRPGALAPALRRDPAIRRRVAGRPPLRQCPARRGTLPLI